MARFFIDRPDLRLGDRDHHHGARRPLDAPPAGLAVPGDRAALGGDQRDLPRRLGETVEDTVTQIIEQQMTGLDGLRYILVQHLDRAGRRSR